MNQQALCALFSNHLSDEQAFALWEFLNELALACDEQYHTQVHRYDKQHHVFEPPQENPWDHDLNDDPPF